MMDFIPFYCVKCVCVFVVFCVVTSYCYSKLQVQSVVFFLSQKYFLLPQNKLYPPNLNHLWLYEA